MPADTAHIFNIQKFSIHDGPGIRTVVFFKGCPLACPWCSNPNSRELQPVMMRDTDDPSVSALDARSYHIDEVMKVCRQDLPFYEESGGGVTVSGGEPLVQHLFVTRLLSKLQSEGIHTAIETTGYAAPHIFDEALRHLDYVLIDIKHHDAASHRRWTSQPNDLPLRNLAHALEAGVDVLPRIPVIPGVNNSMDDAHHFAELLHELGAPKVQLLPFHQFGERKYDLLGWDYAFSGVPSLHDDDIAEFGDVIRNSGVDVLA